MPTTARVHFNEDISRAKELLRSTYTKLPFDFSDEVRVLQRDMRLASVAMAVGAMDAYFCDKYVDCITSALQVYNNNEWPGNFPADYAKISLPAGVVLKASRKRKITWGIRKAARKIMEKESMYSISRIQDCFNPILHKEAKLWDAKIEDFIRLNRKRFTGISLSEYNSLTRDKRTKAKKDAVRHLIKRLGATVQIRHDWIHNCGRPKLVITDLTSEQARVRIWEIETLVTQIDDHIENHRLVP